MFAVPRDQRPERKKEKDGREGRDNTDTAFQTMNPLVLATRLHDLPCLQPARKPAAVFLVWGQLTCGRNSCACVPLVCTGRILPFAIVFEETYFPEALPKKMYVV